ncbi:MAG: nitrite reductase small subunit NirD [Nitrospirae bacterium]|nr:nitrite reductase small subunit NirD [Nitrospirota bacterium]MBI3594563.1 nitrite reductase small subunit NirD [Nitrospirota bacterium]
MTSSKVFKLSDLPKEGVKIIELKGFEIALFHVEQGVRAISNICPHSGGSLGQGLRVGETIICPLHFWKFNLKTGKSSNQPTYCVDTYPVTIEEDWIVLELPEEDLEE